MCSRAYLSSIGFRPYVLHMSDSDLAFHVMSQVLKGKVSNANQAQNIINMYQLIYTFSHVKYGIYKLSHVGILLKDGPFVQGNV